MEPEFILMINDVEFIQIYEGKINNEGTGSLMNGGNPEWKTIEMILDYLGYDFRPVKRKEVKPNKSKTRESAGRKGDI